jgi:hypothetical protein
MIHIVRSVQGTDSVVYFTYNPDSARQRRIVPVGGNTLFVTNLDYRLRSPVLPQLLQFTLFTDVGTVWNRNTLTTFGGFRPYWTPGLGVRVFTPLGPIQVNAGYNPYPPVLGQALFTPSRDLAINEGFKDVYCAVPEGFAGDIPHYLRQNGAWVPIPNNSPCPQKFQPQTNSNFFRRLTFTFSIGPDF